MQMETHLYFAAKSASSDCRRAISPGGFIPPTEYPLHKLTRYLQESLATKSVCGKWLPRREALLRIADLAATARM
jgi:hypothetical protein